MVILQMINTHLGIRTVVMSKISTQYSNIVAMQDERGEKWIQSWSRRKHAMGSHCHNNTYRYQF